MKYEKTQKGNPHKLTVKEHTFPARSISRFTKDNGKVSVSLISKDKVLERKPCDQLFCAKRAWDQNVESEFMKSIEYKYQSLDFDIILRNKEKIKEEENSIITKMFILWMLRTRVKENPIQDYKINTSSKYMDVIGTHREYSKDEQEAFGKK